MMIVLTFEQCRATLTNAESPPQVSFGLAATWWDAERERKASMDWRVDWEFGCYFRLQFSASKGRFQVRRCRHSALNGVSVRRTMFPSLITACDL